MPTRADREGLIAALEQARGGTKVIAYLTSTRNNLSAQMAMDAPRLIYRHVLGLADAGRIPRLDLFLHSDGGDGTVPWKLVSLIREFADEFNVLVPYRAFSAATLTALGADKVLVHPMGMLGPIDPTVTTPYNPPNPENPTERLGISVEDVASYIALVKDDVGIRHEEELVQAFRALTAKIHPLALGTVKRSTSQSRMLGEKLIRTRSDQLEDHDISELVEKLASKLYFHGHPINRREARDELKLDFVVDPEAAESDAMWALYEAYESDMALDRPFNAIFEAIGTTALPLPAPPQIIGPNQAIPSTPSVQEQRIGPFFLAWIQSSARSDRALTEFDVVVTRDWTGETQAKLGIVRSAWEQET